MLLLSCLLPLLKQKRTIYCTIRGSLAGLGRWAGASVPSAARLPSTGRRFHLVVAKIVIGPLCACTRVRTAKHKAVSAVMRFCVTVGRVVP
jgi:hypothetical protein